MTQDSNVINLALALIGVVGTGIGILASLIPTELTSQRDNHQLLAKIWKLLDFEAKSIIGSIASYSNIHEQDPITLMVFTTLPATAWQVAVSNGDFIAEVPQELLSKLSEAYSSVSSFNSIIATYSTYSSTQNAMMDYWNRIKGFYITISRASVHTHDLFQSLEGEITQRILINEKKANSVHRWINILKWVGGVTFGTAILIAVYLGVFLLSHH